MKKVGFIGLGTMGFAMALNVHKAGYSMVLPVYRRDIDQSTSFTPTIPDEQTKAALYDEMLSDGVAAKTPAELFAQSDFIMISMPTSKQVELNMYGDDGITANAKPGTIVIDLTSADASSTQKLHAACLEKGISLLDAPVSGGQKGAVGGSLSVMIGGEKEAFDKAWDLLCAIGDENKIKYVGPSGAGDALKCANNFLSCTCLLATAEALTTLKAAGIDPHTACEVISASGGQSNASSFKFPNLVFTGVGMNMAVDLMKKDIGLYTGLAKEWKVPGFYGNVTYNLFDIQSASGHGGDDFNKVVEMFEDWTGQKLVGIDAGE